MRARLIGITGPSGSGKSTLARAVQARLAPGQCGVLPLDAYYRDLAHLAPAERGQTNFDAPEAINTELLFAQLRRLREGEAIDLPCYDFVTHTRSPSRGLFGPHVLVLIEGLFVLHWPELRALLDQALYLDVPDDVALERRIERDLRERGRDRQSVIDRYRATVRPMAERYVHPMRHKAGLILDGTRPVDELSAVTFQAICRESPIPVPDP